LTKSRSIQSSAALVEPGVSEQAFKHATGIRVAGVMAAPVTPIKVVRCPAPQQAQLPPWQRRTNVWRRITNPTRRAKRPRSGYAGNPALSGADRSVQANRAYLGLVQTIDPQEFDMKKTLLASAVALAMMSGASAAAVGEDSKAAGHYWQKNDPFVYNIMNNHKDTCTWLKTGVEYRISETKEEGWVLTLCLIGPENKDCLWFSTSTKDAPPVTLTKPMRLDPQPQKPGELPACDSPEMEESLVKQNRRAIHQLLELSEWKSGDPTKQRWCYAYYIALPAGTGGSYMEVVFTVEWIDQKTGQYWIQPREQGRTCRGVNGNPWSNERCK
jgi:hypothetical protein